MTEKERINRNIGLCFDFLRQVVKNPKLLDKIPNGSELEFVDKDFPMIIREEKKKMKSKKKYLRVRTEMDLI
jgi:hypothetical protein